MLQFGVSRGRGYPSEVVAEFELKTSVPRQRDRSHSARSEERLHEDGVEGSTTRSDAVDAYFKFGNVPRKTLTQHFFQLRLEHHHALSSLGNPHLLQIVHALAPLVHQ